MSARARTATVALFAAAAAFIAWAGRGLTFHGDDWTFIQTRLGSGVDEYLEPHNEHLSAIPVAVYKALFAIAGLDHPGAYRLVLLVAHLACAALVLAYASRRVGTVAAVLAAALVLFLGQAWEVLFLTIGIGYVVSLAAGIGMLLALDRRTGMGDAVAAALLAVAIASSSLGLPFALGVFVELLAGRRGGGLRRLLVAAVPLALYAIWFVAYRENPTRGIDVGEAPAFLSDVAAAAMGGLTGVAVGSDHLDGGLHWLVTAEHLLALAAAAALVWILATRGVTARVAMLLTTLLAFWLVLGLLRSGGDESFGGAVDPYSGRYVYPGVVLIVLLGVELARGRSPAPRTLRVLAMAVGAVCLANSVWLVVSANDLRDQTEETRGELAAVEVMSGEVSPAYVPSGESRSGNAQAGSYLRAVDTIGSSPAYRAADLVGAPERVRLAADRTLIRIQEIGWLGPAPRRPAAAPPRIERAGPSLRRRGGCVAVGEPGGPAFAEIELGPEGVYLPSTPPSRVDARFRRFADGYGDTAGGLEDAARIRPSLGDLAAPSWHLRLTSAAGFAVCAAP